MTGGVLTSVHLPARRALAAGLLALAACDLAAAFDIGGLTKGLLENAETIGKVIQNPGVLTGQYSEEQERNLGRAASAVLLGAAPLHPDEAVQRYVNRMGAWLARHTERAELPWRFGVLDSPGINAFAAPGGYVFVTRGLIAVLRNEAELAGVLAHEMGHVLARHHLEALTAQERFKLVTDLAVEATDTRGLLSDALVGVTREVYAKGLEQGDEFEADRMGVVIAARAGYDPWGLAHVLHTIQGAAGDARVTGFFLSTHPPTWERLDRLARVFGADFPVPADPRGGAFAAMQARLGVR